MPSKCRTRTIHKVCIIYSFSFVYLRLILSPRNGKDENLIGNTFACKRLEVLLTGFAQGFVTLLTCHAWPWLTKNEHHSRSLSIQPYPRTSGQKSLEIHRGCAYPYRWQTESVRRDGYGKPITRKTYYHHTSLTLDGDRYGPQLHMASRSHQSLKRRVW